MTGRDVLRWAGFPLGGLAWAVHHQLSSDLVFFDCTRGGPLLTGGIGLACILVALAGAWSSWRLRGKPGDDAEPQLLDFAATVSAAAAGLFAFAILLQSLSGFIYPACQR